MYQTYLFNIYGHLLDDSSKREICSILADEFSKIEKNMKNKEILYS